MTLQSVNLSDESISMPYAVLSQVASPPLTTVFHYTDRDGLVNILASERLWATNLWYLNDSEEMRWGFRRIDQALDAFVTTGVPGAQRVDRVRKVLPSIPVVPVYVASFSEDGDALSQWRAYAARGGYSLGLSPPALFAIATAFPGTTVRKVYYETVEHDHYAGALVTELKTVVSAIDEADWSDANVFRIASRYMIAATLLSTQLKHPSFREEHEWRLIVSPPVGAPIRYRNTRSAIAPYVELPLDPHGAVLYDVDLVVGPTAHESLAKHSAQGLIDSKAKKPAIRSWDVRSRNSSIPNRDW